MGALDVAWSMQIALFQEKQFPSGQSGTVSRPSQKGCFVGACSPHNANFKAYIHLSSQTRAFDVLKYFAGCQILEIRVELASSPTIESKEAIMPMQMRRECPSPRS